MGRTYKTYNLRSEESNNINFTKYYNNNCRQINFKNTGIFKINVPKHLYQKQALKKIQKYEYYLKQEQNHQCLEQKMTDLTQLVSEYTSEVHNLSISTFLANKTEESKLTSYLEIPDKNAPKNFSPDEV